MTADFFLEIAQPFMAGNPVPKSIKSPKGRQNRPFVPNGTCGFHQSIPSHEWLGYFRAGFGELEQTGEINFALQLDLKCNGVSMTVANRKRTQDRRLSITDTH